MGTPRKNTGFSILEIMVSLTVIAILSGIAVPAIGGLLDRNRTKAAAIQFQDNLRQARYESKTHSIVSVTFCALQASSAQKTVCATSDNVQEFKNGWQWFVDMDSDGIYELADGDQMLGNTYEADDNDLNILVSDAIENNAIRYTNGKGYIQKANNTTTITPSITFTNKKGGTSTIYFDLSGRSTMKHVL